MLAGFGPGADLSVRVPRSAALANQALARARFTEPADVMGVSGGGVTALQLALDHPGTVRRLVLLAAASRASERGRRNLLRIVELEREGKSAARLGSRLVADGPLRLLLLGGYRLGEREAGHRSLPCPAQPLRLD